MWESRRLPGSGAGPSPDRLLLGSEGTLGGDHRGVGARAARGPSSARAATVRFADLRGRRARRCARSCRRACARPTAAWSSARGGAADAGRRRLARPARARLRGGPVPQLAGRARALPGPRRRGRGAAAAARARGARRSCARRTCATRSWRWACCPRRSRPRSRGSGCRPFVETVEGRGRARRSGRRARVTCRLTHAYPDGAAPYFTVLAPVAARRGGRALGRDQGRRRARRSSPPAARSPTTTRSAATTAPGTTASAPSRSPPRCAPPRPRSTRAGCSTPGYSSTRDEQRQRQEHAGGLQGQGGPRQDLPLGREGHRGPHGLVRHRAHGLGGGRRHLRPRGGRRLDRSRRA